MKTLHHLVALLFASLPAFLLLAPSPAAASAASQWTWAREGADVAEAVGVAPYSPQAYPPLYSFSDVFRLTVAGAEQPDLSTPVLSASQYSVRVAAEPQVAGYVFSIVAVPLPETWLLLLSGMSLAGWVARRRLHSF